MIQKHITKTKARQKLLIYSFLSILVVTTIGISSFIYFQSKSFINSFLLSRAVTAASAFDEKDFSTLSLNSTDETKPEYLRLKSKMMNMVAANSDVRFFYVMVMIHDEVVFVVDSEPMGSENESPPGQVFYEASDSVLKSFSSHTPILTGIETDRWGDWITALSPINIGSEESYVLGVDMSAKKYNVLPFFYALIPSLFLILISFLGFILVHIRKKELAIMDTKTNFVSVASHELRSPLTGIRWSTESILNDKDIHLDPKIRKVLDDVNTSSSRLIYIISELLDLSAYESQKIDPKSFGKVDVNNIIKETVSNLHMAANARKIKINTVGLDSKIFIKGDKGKLSNAFNNIISNAVKYSKEGGNVDVFVTTNDKKVFIKVDDSGIGIPASDIQKVTSGFYRARNAQVHTMDGTGIGLYVTQYAIDSHGGSLELASTENVGTTVTINLPLFKP